MLRSQPSSTITRKNGSTTSINDSGTPPVESRDRCPPSPHGAAELFFHALSRLSMMTGGALHARPRLRPEGPGNFSEKLAMTLAENFPAGPLRSALLYRSNNCREKGREKSPDDRTAMLPPPSPIVENRPARPYEA
jgi:hypothetical protein